MINISWKEGFLSVKTEKINDDYKYYELIFGENEFPFFRYGTESSINYQFDIKFYVEYKIQIYGCNQKSNSLDFIIEKQFNCENQKLLFELEPKNQDECDTWISYLDKFCTRKKFEPFVILNNDFNINTNSVKKIDKSSDIDYYSRYKVCWEENYYLNPKGWLNLTSFELINNCLFKI